MGEEDVKPIEEIANRFLSIDNKTDHFQAVTCQVRFALKIFGGICILCETENGIAAEALVRTLFDCIINTVILAKHPELLPDFVDHGRLNQLEVMEGTRPPKPFEAKYLAVINANKGEVQKLKAKFKSTDTQSSKWHHLKTKDAIKETGLSERMNLIYYKRASNIAHGEPMAIVKAASLDWTKWKVCVPEAAWKRFETLSFTQARLLVIFMFSALNDHLKLGYDDDLKRLAEWTDQLKKADMDKFLPR